MKIYAIIMTVVAALAIVVAGLVYWQGIRMKDDLATTQSQLKTVQNNLDETQTQLSGLRNLLDTGLNNTKASAEILKDSSESFLVAGDVKVASLGANETAAVTSMIQNISDKQNKIALENLWSDFLKTKTVSNYLAFANFLAGIINQNLANIH